MRIRIGNDRDSFQKYVCEECGKTCTIKIPYGLDWIWVNCPKCTKRKSSLRKDPFKRLGFYSIGIRMGDE